MFVKTPPENGTLLAQFRLPKSALKITPASDTSAITTSESGTFRNLPPTPNKIQPSDSTRPGHLRRALSRSEARCCHRACRAKLQVEKIASTQLAACNLPSCHFDPDWHLLLPRKLDAPEQLSSAAVRINTYVILPHISCINRIIFS